MQRLNGPEADSVLAHFPAEIPPVRQLIKAKDVALKLGVSVSWVIQHASGKRQPYLPAVKMGPGRSPLRFDPRDVEKFIDQCRDLAGSRVRRSKPPSYYQALRILGMQPNSLAGPLLTRQLRSGGWSYFGSQQSSVEATSLAVMALSTESPNAARSGFDQMLDLQRRDGAWPAFVGDSEASWTTALALCALNGTGEFTSAREKAFHWLVEERGREAHWLWRWKFKTTDRNVRFNPDKYGWPWISGSASWVIPTAFSIVAIKQFTVCNRSEASEKRIHLGVDLLLDRACVDGGWNSGNSVVYGVPLRPHVEATAVALLALQDEQRTEVIQRSLAWLNKEVPRVDSVSSLAWCILSLFVYQESVEELKNRLAKIMGDGREVGNNATLASALLALKCG